MTAIHAYSPQAKGRIERLFGVFQDRLIKEMRLSGIKSKEEANEFLKEYLPKHNKRFGVSPSNKTDMHIRLIRHFNLDNYLCVKTQRTVRNDNTIAHNGKLYQVEESVKTKKVIMEERVDGSLHITSDGVALRYREIMEKPPKEFSAKSPRPRKSYIPPRDHPWRRWQNRNALHRRAYAY